MQATSNAQYDSTVRDTIPDLERVRDGVWALATPLSVGIVPYTLTYLIRDSAGGLHVVDPGWDSVDNWGGLVFAINRIGHGMADVASIIATHLHPDHTGLAVRLRKASGAPIIMHRAEQTTIDDFAGCGLPHPEVERWGVPANRLQELWDVTEAADCIPSFTADTLVDDGDALDIPGRHVTVLHTPGHTTGAISLVQADEKLIYTGDTVLPSAYPSIGIGGPSRRNPLADYLDSLENLKRFDDHEACPGHGYRFLGLAQRVERTVLHHTRRTRDIERALVAMPNATVWQIAAGLSWPVGWSNLHGFYLQAALAQTAMQIDLINSVERV